jgi:hypothetical protein
LDLKAFQSDNLEIRRFLAVLENTSPKLENLLLKNNEIYYCCGSCQV